MQEIAAKDSQNALRDANTYGDQKALEMYKYIDGRFREIEGQLGQQAVQNQATKDSFQLLQERMECCCEKQAAALECERKERRGCTMRCPPVPATAGADIPSQGGAAPPWDFLGGQYGNDQSN